MDFIPYLSAWYCFAGEPDGYRLCPDLWRLNCRNRRGPDGHGRRRISDANACVDLWRQPRNRGIQRCRGRGHHEALWFLGTHPQ